MGRTVIEVGSLTRNSTATYWDASSELQTAAIDTARTGYDPADGTLRGLLIEEARTNSLLDPRDLSTVNWTDVRGGITINQNVTGIDGAANTAWTVSESSASVERMRQTGTVADDLATHVATAFIKKNSGDEANGFPAVGFLFVVGSTTVVHVVVIDTRDGSNAAPSSNNDGAHIVEDAGDWWKITIALTNNNTGNTESQYRIFPAWAQTLGAIADGNATGTVVYDYGGIELNASHATSPIVGTREADNATDTISTWPVSVSYEIVATPSADQDGVLYQADDGSENNRVRFERISGNLHVIVTNGGTEQCDLDLGALTDFTEFTVRAAFADNDIAASLNSAAVVTDSNATIPTGLTTRRYGKDTAGEHWNAWIKHIEEFTERLTNTDLTA